MLKGMMLTPELRFSLHQGQDVIGVCQIEKFQYILFMGFLFLGGEFGTGISRVRLHRGLHHRAQERETAFQLQFPWRYHRIPRQQRSSYDGRRSRRFRTFRANFLKELGKCPRTQFWQASQYCLFVWRKWRFAVFSNEKYMFPIFRTLTAFEVIPLFAALKFSWGHKISLLLIFNESEGSSGNLLLVRDMKFLRKFWLWKID